HQASDDLMTLANYRGVARTKIAFVSDRDAVPGRKTKEIYVMDYDGYNPRRVTVNRSLNILPNWSPDGRSLAYVSYRRGNPDIFIASIYEGKSADLTSDKGGGAFAPSFSPDGKRVAYASSRQGNMDIWVASVDGSSPRRLTQGRRPCEYPSWAPSGRHRPSACGRGGKWKIAVADRLGQTITMLPAGPGKDEQPDWVP